MAQIEEPSIKLEFDPLNYSDVEEEAENEDFFDNLPEEVDYKSEQGIVLVERFELNTPDDLRFLVNLEEKTLFPIYKKQGNFSPHERGILTRLMVKNLLKHNVERIISRAKFEFYSKLITMVFTKEETETYFHYSKGQVRGSLYNMYCKIRKEYKAAGILGKKRKIEDVPEKYERATYESKKLGILQDTVNFELLKDKIKIQASDSIAVIEVGSSDQSNKRPREDFEENCPGVAKKTKETENEVSLDQFDEEEYTISYIDESELQEQDSKTENSDSGIVLIKNFHLETEEDLRFLVNLEEKTFIPIYEKNGVLSPYERGTLCRLMIKNLLKQDPEKTISRNRLEFYSELICKVFPKENPEVYFKYMDRKSYGTLFNAYMRVKKEYKSAGIVKYKYKEYQEEAQELDKTLRAAEQAELERNQRVQ